MNFLYQSALAWKELTEYTYRLTYGYKKQLHSINLTFSFEDYPHLAGFQYLKASLDNDFTLYSFHPKMYSFITTIKADYLISSHTTVHSFIFIIQATKDGAAKCDFLCCSAFRQGDRNYESNQKHFTLLRKERLHIPNNISTLFFDKITAHSD